MEQIYGYFALCVALTGIAVVISAMVVTVVSILTMAFFRTQRYISDLIYHYKKKKSFVK